MSRFTPKVITANRLREGDVVYQTADDRWTRHHNEAELIEDEALADEVAGLIEWPVPLMGAFDPAFLAIPGEVIRATIRANQKCFVLKGADGKLYDESGQLVNSSGKPINDKGQVIDDYWLPDKVAERLADDAAQYDTVNQQMEQRFGDNWNANTGKWESWADSASERKRLGIYNIPYEYPSKSDLMRSFESWYYENPGKTVEDWFAYLMGAPGFGIAGDPASALGYGQEPAQMPSTLGGMMDYRVNGGGSQAGGAVAGSWLYNALMYPQAPPDDATQ